MVSDVWEGKRHGEGKRDPIDWHSVCSVFQQVRSGINGLAWLVMVKTLPSFPLFHSSHLSVSKTDLQIHTYSLCCIYLFIYFYTLMQFYTLTLPLFFSFPSNFYFHHGACWATEIYAAIHLGRSGCEDPKLSLDKDPVLSCISTAFLNVV